ncbi:MAG: radical SAM protein [Pseudomonadota bacterium]
MLDAKKFQDPFTTAKGETRASVTLKSLDTLWFNTGTQCNLSCENCYIESNPKNDRLVYIKASEVACYLDEVQELSLLTKEVGLTGGEPFLNPEIIDIIEASLSRGFKTLVLTNAYRLMNRKKEQLISLNTKYPGQLTLRVSLDHFQKDVHEKERGRGTFEPALKATKWIFDSGIQLAVAGRALLDEDFDKSKEGYRQLLSEYQIDIDTEDTQSLVVFPEMSDRKDVPEITTACWDILNQSPDNIMCSSSRMVVKRKGEEKPKVLACTLLAYDQQFELGQSLKESKKRVQLNHKFCAQFCVLGGASCS